MTQKNVRISGVLVQRMNEETSNGVVTQGAAFRINHNFRVVALCHCGRMFITQRNSLRNGHTTSCGCNRDRLFRERVTKHGECTGRVATPEYQAWQSIKARCYIKSTINYDNYGGRGIVMCNGWMDSQQSFVSDMGRKPSMKHSVDRRDSNGNYSCGHCEECVRNGWTDNCRWATRVEQNNNTRRNRMMTFYGKTMSVSDWSRISQINPAIVRKRLDRGVSDKEAMWTPVVVMAHDRDGRFTKQIT